MAKKFLVGACIFIMASFCLSEFEIHRIPRISFVDGEVRILDPGTSDWSLVDINLPLEENDRLRLEDASLLEMEMDDGSTIRFRGPSEWTPVHLLEKSVHFNLNQGTIGLSLTRDKLYSIQFQSQRIVFIKAGHYRVDHIDNRLSLSVYSGKALLDGNVRETVSGGQTVLLVPDGTLTRSEALPQDTFFQWCQARDARYNSRKATRYLPDSGLRYGVMDLDIHGSWRYMASMGYCWSPFNAGLDWSPYQNGYWRYSNNWGWTWVSYDPWGWLPFHYGRWMFHNHYGWMWTPGPCIDLFTWSPAVVRFGASNGYLGWIPLAPGDEYLPYSVLHQQAEILTASAILNISPGNLGLWDRKAPVTENDFSEHGMERLGNARLPNAISIRKNDNLGRKPRPSDHRGDASIIAEPARLARRMFGDAVPADVALQVRTISKPEVDPLDPSLNESSWRGRADMGGVGSENNGSPDGSDRDRARLRLNVSPVPAHSPASGSRNRPGRSSFLPDLDGMAVASRSRTRGVELSRVPMANSHREAERSSRNLRPTSARQLLGPALPYINGRQSGRGGTWFGDNRDFYYSGPTGSSGGILISGSGSSPTGGASTGSSRTTGKTTERK